MNLMWNENAFDVLPRLADESVDLVVTDPPYGIARNTVISRKDTKDIDFNFGEWDVFENEDDYYNFTYRWVEQASRILKPNGWIYVFFAHEKYGIINQIAKDFGLDFRCSFTWIKSNPAPSYRKYNWISSTEVVWIGSKGKCRIPNFLNQTDMKNYMVTSCRSNYGVTGHPTEKPVQLIERFVLSSSNVGDTVLDCFMGSGTTGVACKELGRKFRGIEGNEKWFLIARDRIDNTKPIIKQKQGDALLV